MPNLLVTGGAGFIGGNFVHYWAQAHPGDAIVVLDCLTYAGNETIAGVENAELVVGDIRDTALVQKLLREREIATIVHLAAESHVDRSIMGSDAFVQTNIVGTHSLLEAARAAWLDTGSGLDHRFHHVSTDEVFGSLGAGDPPFSETLPYAPNSPYAASKAASDHLVRAHARTFGLQASISYASNNYGPYQYPEKLIPLFLTRALSGKELPIYGDGTNRREWLHVEDHCVGLEACLLEGESGEAYNIGSGEELANIEVVDLLCEALDQAFAQDQQLAAHFPRCPAAEGRSCSELKIFVADRKGHDWRYALDDERRVRGCAIERAVTSPMRYRRRWAGIS